MKVEFNNLVRINNTNFSGARARKLIEKIKNADKLDKLDISFNELKSMYEEIGYDVFYNRGSHAVVPVSEDFNIPLVIPHSTKNVTTIDLWRFKYVLNGEPEKAKNIR